MYDVGGIVFGFASGKETEGVSRSSKQIPPGEMSVRVGGKAYSGLLTR